MKSEHIYFKLKGEKTVSSAADFMELATENPNDRKLPVAKYYYSYKNLQWLDQPIKLTELKYFKTGTTLRNDAPGACVILDPLFSR